MIEICNWVNAHPSIFDKAAFILLLIMMVYYIYGQFRPK